MRYVSPAYEEIWGRSQQELYADFPRDIQQVSYLSSYLGDTVENLAEEC